MRLRYLFAAAAVALSILPAAALAHVVVKPAEVGIGAFQTFTTGMPNEKDQNAIALRLVMPDGLKYVSPNVKPGWTISEKKSGDGEDATVTEITWTGGIVPPGQRDDFLFSAQAPSSASELHWKAYQTYADGTVVSWDQTPNGKDDETVTPYSVTKVVNDLTTTTTPAKSSDGTAKAALYISILAVVLAGVAVLRRKA